MKTMRLFLSVFLTVRKMQSTNIVITHQNRCFGALVGVSDKYFAIKFDTGASRTLISAELLTGILNDKQIKALKDYCQSKQIMPVPCVSASGHKFDAYPAYINNICIGGHRFEKFYYYLVIDRLKNGRKIALLGDDFIDCCGFSKEPHGNIVISGFDFKSYKNDQEKILTTEDISSII